jgi:replicative DNA helicase
VAAPYFQAVSGRTKIAVRDAIQSQGKHEDWLSDALMHGNRFVCVDQGTMTLENASTILMEVREWVGIPVRWVVFDHFQLLRSKDHKRSFYETYTEISRALKRWAKDEGVAVLSLSQLARSAPPPWEAPTLDGMRDTGAIEEDCDVCMGLWRPELDPEFNENVRSDPALAGYRDILRARILKGRSGGTGTVIEWSWDKPTCQLSERI